MPCKAYQLKRGEQSWYGTGMTPMCRTGVSAVLGWKKGKNGGYYVTTWKTTNPTNDIGKDVNERLTIQYARYNDAVDAWLKARSELSMWMDDRYRQIWPDWKQ